MITRYIARLGDIRHSFHMHLYLYYFIIVFVLFCICIILYLFYGEQLNDYEIYRQVGKHCQCCHHQLGKVIYMEK